MSYCTVEDIGGNVNANSVLEAAWVIEEYSSPHTLWSPSATWTINDVVYTIDGADIDVDTSYGILSVSQIQAWLIDGQLLDLAAPAAAQNPRALVPRQVGEDLAVTDSADRILTHRGFRLPEGARQWALDGYALRFTGVRGFCTLDALSDGDDVLAGQTVVRAGESVFYAADGTAEADDQLIVPPPILRKCAISIAKRLTFLRRDKRAKFDDIASEVIDGWEFVLEAFTP